MKNYAVVLGVLGWAGEVGIGQSRRWYKRARSLLILEQVNEISSSPRYKMKPRRAGRTLPNATDVMSERGTDQASLQGVVRRSLSGDRLRRTRRSL